MHLHVRAWASVYLACTRQAAHILIWCNRGLTCLVVRQTLSQHINMYLQVVTREYNMPSNRNALPVAILAQRKSSTDHLRRLREASASSARSPILAVVQRLREAGLYKLHGSG